MMVMMLEAMLRTKNGIFSESRDKFLERSGSRRLRGYRSNKSRMSGRVTAIGLDIRAKVKKRRQIINQIRR